MGDREFKDRRIHLPNAQVQVGFVRLHESKTFKGKAECDVVRYVC